MNEPRIVCAATRFELTNGDLVVVCSPRHWDSITHNVFDYLDDDAMLDFKEEQGFVDQFGKFYTRRHAWVIAEKNNQIIRRVGGDGEKLYSENLY